MTTRYADWPGATALGCHHDDATLHASRRASVTRIDARRPQVIHWHYIRYGDGSQELYDHRTDPHEWRNVADQPQHAEVIRRLSARLPKRDADPVLSDWQNWEIQAWRAAEQNRQP